MSKNAYGAKSVYMGRGGANPLTPYKGDLHQPTPKNPLTMRVVEDENFREVGV